MRRFTQGAQPGWLRLAWITGILAGLALAVAAQVTGARPAHAATHTWSGLGGNPNWSTPGNWSDTPPATNEVGAVLLFGGALQLVNNNNLTGLGIASVTFSSNGFTITGNNVSLTGNVTDGASGGTNTWTLGTVTNSSTTISVSTGETLVMSGAISGTGSLVKAGAGRLNIQNTTGPSGTLTLNAGRLDVGGTLAASQLNLNGGTFQPAVSGFYSQPVVLGGSVTIASTQDQGFSGGFTGGGDITYATSGNVALIGTATHTGATIVNSGTVSTAPSGALSPSSPLTINGGTVELGPSTQSIPSLSGAGGTFHISGGTGAVTFNGSATTTYLGAFTCGFTCSVIKSGTGTQTLAGSISYPSGSTTVSNGTLILAPVGPATFADITLTGGTLQFGGSQAITLSGQINGAGTLADADSALLTIFPAGGTFSGPFSIAFVASAVLGTSWSTGALSMTGGSLDLAGFSFVAPVLNGSGAISLGGGSLTLGASAPDSSFGGSITGAGTLTKVAASQLTLLGVLNYTGLTTLSAGRLSIAPAAGAVNLSGGLTLSGGSLNLGGVSPINLGGPINGSADVLDVSGNTVTVTPAGGSYTGSWTIDGLAGTFRLGGDWIAGPASVLHGTLDLNNHNLSVPRLSGGAAGTVATRGGFLNVGESSASQSAFAGTITGAGSLVKFGISTLTLSGASTYTGLTALAGGALVVDGSLAAAGLVNVSPGATLAGRGSVGAISSAGAIAPGLVQRANLGCASASFNSGSELKIMISSPVAGTGYDRLSCAAAVLFGAGAGAPMLTLTVSTGLPEGSYTILHSDLPGIAPEFKNWADGTSKTVNGQVFRLGHTSKDVTLTKLGGGRYRSLTPYRVLDTRPPANQTLGPGATLDLAISPSGSGGNSVPAGAGAAVLNVTAVGPSQGTFLSLYPRGSPPNPLSSNLNVGPGQTIANLVTVQLDPQGFVTILNSVGNVDVVVDVQGWFTATPDGGGDPSGLYKAPAEAPIRILDTRPGTKVGPYSNPIPPDSSIDVQVSPNGLLPGMPPGSARAVVLNVTAIGPSQSTFLTVYPTDSPSRPTASNVNVAAGLNLPNRVIVKLSALGQITVYNSAGYVDVAIDFAGYFTAADDPDGSLFHPLTPVRAFDSRPAGTFGSGETRPIPIVGSAAPVPAAATAVVGNATAVAASAPSYLSIYPQGGSRPTVSDLNYTSGDTVPNLVLVRLGTGGQIAVYNNNGSVDFVFDVYGWFGTDPTPR